MKGNSLRAVAAFLAATGAFGFHVTEAAPVQKARALFRQTRGTHGSLGPPRHRRKKFKPSVHGEHRRKYWKRRGL